MRGTKTCRAFVYINLTPSISGQDNETYKINTKKQIKDWHTTVSQRKNQEWLIVHVVRPDARTAAGGFFQMKGTVLDKIKADFNVDKRDRYVTYVWSVSYCHLNL